MAHPPKLNVVFVPVNLFVAKLDVRQVYNFYSISAGDFVIKATCINGCDLYVGSFIRIFKRAIS